MDFCFHMGVLYYQNKQYFILYFLYRWNFSVGQHKLNYVNDNQREQSERLHEERSKAKPNIQVSIPEGLVVGVQKQSQTKDEHLSNNVLWKNKFDTPVAAVWLLEDGMIEKLDLLEIAMPPKSLTESDIPLMYYVGKLNIETWMLDFDLQI